MAMAASAPTKIAIKNERDIYGLSGDVKKNLLNYLDNIATAGDFATMRSIPELSVSPEVRLLGSENQKEVEIGVPLGLQDAQKLINVARQAPFGKGEQTIVDTTWELNPSQFSLSEKWQPYVDGLMRSACDGLGVKSNDIRAELYKMLLYEKGAMFKPHADSEKVNGMFGTLVISLPSAHFGGSVVLSHNGKQHEFQTSYHEYLAWYSNVTHEIKEVTSGCRWVLTYNLVRENLGESALDSQIAGRKLHAILADWKQQNAEAAATTTSPPDRAPKDGQSSSVSLKSASDDVQAGFDVKQAIYLLEHKYTQSNLSIESLKGADRLRAKELSSISDDYGYTLYLASLEREVMGQADEDDSGHNFSETDDDDEEEDEDDESGNSSQYSGDSYHRIWDVCSEDITLTRVVDLGGHEVLKDIPIEEKDIVQVRPFKRKPNKSEYEGYTGNEGASATHWYKDTVIVLIPNDSFADVMMHRPKYTPEVVPAERVSMMLEYLTKRVQDTPKLKSEELKQSVRRACDLIAARNNSPGCYQHGGTRPTYTDEIILDAFKVCITLGMREPLRDLVTAFRNETPDFVVRSLRDLISGVGFEEIKPIYNNIIRKNEGVSARFKALSLLIGADPLTIDTQTEILPEVKTWVKESLEFVFSDLGSLTGDDARELARFAAAEPSGVLLRDQIAPKIYEQLNTPTPTKTSFVMSFLCRLVEQSESSGADNNQISETYKSILEVAIPGFALRKPDERPYHGYGWDEPVREPVLDGHVLVPVVQHCRKSSLDNCVDQLVGRILQEIIVMDPKEFPITILPLLDSLLIDIKNGDIQAGRFRYLFQSSLIQWIVRHVGKEPKQLDWSREPVECHGDRYAHYSPSIDEIKNLGPCQDCQQMNKFLQDPRETVGRYPVAEKRRDHLQYKLEDKHQCSTTVEKTARPFILVVTKHKKGTEEKHRKWAARVTEVKLHLKDLEGRHRLLDNVLAEKYSDIMVVRANKLVAEVGQAAEGAQDQVSGSMEENAENNRSPRGQKRKAVVVDLTDDRNDVTATW